MNRFSITVLAAAGMVGSVQSAMGEQSTSTTTPTPAQESAKSSPPDMTHYVRPVIPEDRMPTPLSKPGDAHTPSPAPKDATAPEPKSSAPTSRPE
jgi:hypothetical protein